jgi:hypothetical protein
MSERDEMSKENNSLKSTVEVQKEEKVREVADKEREKVQAIDRLRDEMLTKIKDMRSNLLSLKKEQLGDLPSCRTINLPASYSSNPNSLRN